MFLGSFAWSFVHVSLPFCRLNSARIGASFVGPVFATTLLAWAPPSSVELALAALALLLVPVVASRRGESRRPRMAS